MTQPEAKIATSADGSVTKDAVISGHENGPGKLTPAETEHDAGSADVGSADPVEVTDQSAAPDAKKTTGDEAAPAGGEGADKPVNGDAKPVEDTPKEQDAADAPPAAASSDDVPAAELSADTQQRSEAGAGEAPAPDAESAGAGAVQDEPAAAAPGRVAGAAGGSVQQDEAEADPLPRNGTAEKVAEPKEEDKQPQQDSDAEAAVGGTQGNPVKEVAEPSPAVAEKPSRAAKPSPAVAEKPTPAAKPSPAVAKPNPAAKPSPAVAEPSPAVEKPIPAVAEPSPAVEKPTPAVAKPSPAAEKLTPAKGADEKLAQPVPEAAEVSKEDAGNTSDVPAAASPKGTPLMTPPGTVQALSRRLSSTSLATPTVKSTPSDRQLGGAVGSATPGAAVGGRTTKSPPASKSGEASPLSTHDTKNTINVSQLLKKGAFKMQPLKDFVPYEELQRLRVEDGIDATRREDYLGDADFQTVFGMDRDAFKKQPAWRQAQAKKKANLF